MTEMTLEEFLGPISAALGHDAVPDKPAGAYDPSRGLAREEYAALSPDDLAARFEEEGRLISLETRRVAPEEAAAAVVAQVRELEGTSVVFADDPLADAYGLPTALEAAGLAATRWDAAQGRAAVDACATADVGVCFPFAGIARTATVAIRCDERCGRAVSLLPTASVAVVPKSRLVPQMIDVLEQVEAEAAAGTDTLPSSIVFSTGPSATSDIELVRVVGVHGPVSAAVIIVED